MRFFISKITGYTSPEGAVSYTYDANGNVLTVNDSHGTITRTYDALNRVSSYTDTYGKVIRYEYDAVGNLSRLIYPDNTAVTYEYDANHNLTKVTDWANRITTYTYDINNRVIGVTKPDGSTTTTAYDNKQRVTSTVERTSTGVVITGFEYTYDDLSRIIEEKVLANSTKMCYTYDSLNRVTARTIKKLSDNSVIATETFSYDAAGNITDAPDSCFQYDTNNRLVVFNGNSVSYDLDGNMLSNGSLSCTYDSANRLLTAGGHTYTYDASDVRIRNLCADEDTTYTYDTHAKLSRLLCKTTNGVATKYVYGRGLIGEEVDNTFKTYHFDCRGSTVAITDMTGNITDTFKYDTYGKLISKTGTSKVIFGYNGRDGVVTDDNGLIYMRARYYSPEMKRFVNADIVAGQISNAVTLNRFAYANGNPVSFVDPFGLSVWSWFKEKVVDPVGNALTTAGNWVNDNIVQPTIDFFSNDSHKVEGTVSNDSVYASGSVSGGNNDFNFSDKGEYDVIPEKEYNGFTGAEAGLTVANAEGEVGYKEGDFKASIGGNVDVLTASAAAGVAHGGEEKGFKLGAGASVVSGQAGVTFELFGIGFEIGVSADVLTAEASLNAGVIETKGKKKLSFGAKVGALLFGLGFDIGIIVPA